MHVIRLRGPWQLEPLGDGGACCRRTFHKPTGLDAGERVWLVVERPAGRAAVRLNGRALGVVEGEASVGRFDVTGRLADGNSLEIDVERAAPDAAAAGELVGAVRLEIEA